MQISKDEEVSLRNLSLKIQMSSKSDLIHYCLQFVEDICECVLVASGTNLVLKTKEILEQNLLEELKEQKLYDEFTRLVETKDDTIKIEFENEIGCKNFFLFMCRLCYFNLRHLKKKKIELEFLDVLYEKLEN